MPTGKADIIGFYDRRVCMLGRKGGRCYVVQGYGNPLVDVQNMKKEEGKLPKVE